MSTSVVSVTSHFPSAENGFTTTLASTIGSAATTVPLNSVAGYVTGEVVAFIVDPSDAAKKQTFVGIIDTVGVQLTSVVWTAGTNQTHTGGATVVDYASATHISMITKGLLVSHNQDGTLKVASYAMREVTITSSATPTPNADTTDIYTVTALATPPTFAAPTGTPIQGQKLTIRIKDNATARALAWNAIYRAMGNALPTTTVLSKTLYLGFIYNSTDVKWDLVAVAQEV